MRSVVRKSGYKEFLIEYDTRLGMYWISGLTNEDFWEDLEHVIVWDNPQEQVNELLADLKDAGVHVDVIDITEEDDTYSDD